MTIVHFPAEDFVTFDDVPVPGPILREFIAAVTKQKDRPLSAREEQVSRLIAEGVPQKEIAARLQLSPKTVNTYLTNAKEALGIRTTAELIRAFTLQGFAVACTEAEDAAVHSHRKSVG